MIGRTLFIWPGLLLIAMIARGADRPNFLFIYTDDQRWDAMSCVQKEQEDKGRFPWFVTPNMDRLAREGVRFRNAFVVNSLCAPSRSCFLTGQYSHLNGVANNHTPMPLENATHATLLRKAGYVTGYFGKWHHDAQRERPGFDVVASFVGQGKYVDCPMLVNGALKPTQGWVDDVTTDYAIQFIRENKDKPFDLVVGFKSPHGPRTPPQRAAGRFTGETARAVPNLGVAAPYLDPAAKRPAPAGGRFGEGALNYFRCTSAADDCIGRLLATLDELKLAENTVVVFASDNGFYFGEHSLADKRSAYDESMRIPLIVRFPNGAPAGKVMDELVLNIDLAPTVLDYAGVEVPAAMQGRSWRPLLEAKQVTPWRRAFFYEYFFEKGFPGIPTVTAVRTDAAKLIKYPGHDEWTELFDLQKDPFELKNLIKEESARQLREAMEAEYAKQAKAVEFRIPEFADKQP